MPDQATSNSYQSERRLDRSSWITLVIALVMLILALTVLAAAYQLPSDGWLVDRGLWGRYKSLTYLVSLPGINPEIQTGDVLLEVEGESFELLESRAAVLEAARPEYWEIGQTVHYTLLRDGSEVEVSITLQRPPLFIGYRPPLLQTNLNAVADLIVFALAALLMLLRPKNRATQLLFIFALSIIIIDQMNFGLPAGVSDLFSTASYWPRLLLSDLSWFLFILPLFIHLFLTFPLPKNVVLRHWWFIPSVYFLFIAAGFLYLLISISEYFIDGETYVTPIVLIAVLVLVFILVHSVLTIKDPIPRMQMRWIAFGAIIGIAGTVTLSLVVELSDLASLVDDASAFYFWYGLIAMLLFLTLPACLALAILRYRLWDIEVIINRSLVYGTLTLLLGLIYFGGVVLLQELFRGLAGQDSPLAIVISTLVIAAVFSPLRRRVQHFIDRRFYRSKYNAEMVLEHFALSVRDEANLARLTSELQRVTMSAMQAKHVSIWLKEPNENR